MNLFSHSNWSILLQFFSGASRSALFLVACLWFLVAPTAHAVVDSNNNGVSDVWERYYNSGNLYTAFNPLADPDGDGWTNAIEAISGTDPFNANSVTGFLQPVIVHIPAVYANGPNGNPEVVTPEAITIEWSTLTGKQYTLLASPDLSPGSWSAVGPPQTSSGEILSTGIVLTQSDGSTPPSMFLKVAVNDTDSDDDDLPDFDEGLVGSSKNNADSDGDGISDAAEIAAGTNPNSRDSDGDSNEDGDDADPQEALVNWPSVPEAQFALVEVDTPPGIEIARDVNDKGDVLFHNGIWESGNWIPMIASAPSSSYTVNDMTIEYNLSFHGWHSLNNNRSLLGWGEVHFTTGQVDALDTVSTWIAGQSPSHLIDGISPTWTAIDLVKPLGIDNSGRCFVMNNYREPLTGQARSRIAVVGPNGSQASFLTPGNGYFVAGNSGHFDVSGTGAIAVNTTSQLNSGNTATSYRVAMWDSQLNEVSLPPEATGWHYPLHLTDLPNGKTALTATKTGDGGGSVYIQSAANTMARVTRLSGKNVELLAGDGTAITRDNSLWRNGKLTALRDLCPRYGELVTQGYQFTPLKANKHGSYLMQAEDPQGNPKTFAALPMQLVSRDKFLAGSFRIPESYTHLEIEFGGHEDLGRYGDLLGGGITKVFDSVDQILRNTNGSTEEQPADQKVWFVKDSTDPRKINFYTCFSTIGKVEIKLHLNNGGSAQPTVVTHQLITAPDFAPIISYVDRWVKGSSFTGQWANTTWLAMNTTDIAGPLANETRSCLIPFFDIISQVTGFTPLVMGLCDGIRMGFNDDKQFAALIANLSVTSQGWLQAQAIAEVLRWHNDPKVRYNQLKEILNDLCRIVVLPHLSDLGETFTTWEGFRKKAWKVWEAAHGVDKMLRVVPLASMGFLADAAIEWGNDFCTRMLSGAEKTAWDTTTWNRVRLTSGSLIERNMSYYTFGYTFGYLSEQAAVAVLTGGVTQIAKVTLKGGVSLIGKLGPRTLAVVAMRLNFIKEALTSMNLMDDGLRLAHERMMVSAAREPTSPLIKETSASLMESRMANSAFNRATFNFKAMMKAVMKTGNISKLIKTPGREGQFMQKCAQWMELMGDKATAPAAKGWLETYERLLKFENGAFVEDCAEDFFKLMKLETAEGKEAARKSLEDYAARVAIDPVSKLWIKDIDKLQEIGYRYSSFVPPGGWSTYGGQFPNGEWFCSLNKFESPSIANDALLLPGSTANPRYRFEFNTSTVSSKSRLARGQGDTGQLFEPLTRDIPDGPNAHTPAGGGTSGGATQFIVDGEFLVTSVWDMLTGIKVWPPN